MASLFRRLSIPSGSGTLRSARSIAPSCDWMNGRVWSNAVIESAGLRKASPNESGFECGYDMILNLGQSNPGCRPLGCRRLVAQHARESCRVQFGLGVAYFKLVLSQPLAGPAHARQNSAERYTECI